MMIKYLCIIHKYFLLREFLNNQSLLPEKEYNPNYRLSHGFGRKSSLIGYLTFMKVIELLTKHNMEELKLLEAILLTKMGLMTFNFNRQVILLFKQKSNTKRMILKS